MARNDERRRDRQDTERGLRELADADWDETSEVVKVAADTAARTAKQLSRPDIEDDAAAPETKAPASVFVRDDGAPRWVRIVAASVVALTGAAVVVLEALRQVGVLK
jgi:hypothetical protein